ncbi:E3 ubiquitin-protein ligase RNF13-like [Teleopsis dalmanni]|uniref:E3 ubiquitin-protein ligase RNF13-like n=1 Tax=Teleopsis dalmanni TaxID=139649 RepID=UPI0018CDC071|nr:E3 ubiquitin-protein ligase RNF13-like [Teleopsis dalmanni]XP_037949271.1 E3 ubiquitin-protein ligase RNF13-like [Teleopsis dalmanni]XP_037949272.1 E3 ubiquitin-protein ligase RNF13-like [Teleopsis dalmanni]
MLLQDTKIQLVVFKIAILGLCIVSDAHILVYNRNTNKLIEEYNDMPAAFGPSLPSSGLKYIGKQTNPFQGCTKIDPINKGRYASNSQFVAIIERGGDNCSFELKVRNAQEARYDCVIVYNNKSDDLEQMRAENSTGIYIPSVFVGYTTGLSLILQSADVILVINDEPPFNINTQLILPFSILIGLCFLVMIFYMIYKCVREERRVRRNRLPKRLLKKLPILKYTKNSDIVHDTCVICLDEFVEGDKLRVLPCRHPYHSHCIDPWLTENRRVCPICKRKVFTKGTARSNRNRQSSLDSVSDTDDDTTPLLQPSGNTSTVRTATEVIPTTRHGTFTRESSNTTVSTALGAGDVTSDEENVLLAHQSPSHNSRRVNPFDRTPNNIVQQTSQTAEELNGRPNLFRTIYNGLFRRVHPISVAAPPYLEEVVADVASTNSFTIPATYDNASHSSNNILNPNLSGSFKDEDESPHQSIYEPIAVVTPTNPSDSDAIGNNMNDPNLVFIQTPTQGGIGVVALPNANHSDTLRGPTYQPRNATANTDRQFFI